jgi:L-ascorbate metabolism protein UlaG (beta-lactamase superfamily)
MSSDLTSGLHWLGHDGFRIEWEGVAIYIDPYHIKGGPPADLILITHDHFDHCSPEDINRIRKPDTVFVTVADAATKVEGTVEVVKPGSELTLRGVHIRAVPAYNINKFRSPGNPFHPRERGFVGFVLTLGDRTIYHTGDSDHIPEMAGLKPDVALLPVSGIYVMTAQEAAEAANAIQPKLAIPMHIGADIGKLSDAETFRSLAKVPVEILPLET